MYSTSMMQPSFNVFVMLELSKIDYLNAKAEALRRLHERFSDAGEMEAKEKAEELLERLKKEIRHGV